MIAEDCSITHDGMARLRRLVNLARTQVRQTCALCNRVSDSLTALRGGEEDAEGGWRR